MSAFNMLYSFTFVLFMLWNMSTLDDPANNNDIQRTKAICSAIGMSAIFVINDKKERE